MNGLYFIFSDGGLMVDKASATVPTLDNALRFGADVVVHNVGQLDGRQCFAVMVSRPVDIAGCEFVPLRSTFGLVPDAVYAMAGRAWQTVFWDANTHFCPKCGAPTVHNLPLAKTCTACGNIIYPTIAPAAIVLVRRGDDEILLVRALNFRGSHFGLVAGFLEIGESLEQCVERELMEETSISVRNIRYYGSQSWPYPSGLMVGYVADYAGGTISIQREELAEAAFFDRSHLPQLPRPASIAREMIDAWLARRI